MTEITVVIEPPLPDIEVTLAEVGLVGPAGPGVPVGGTTGQVLAKASDTDRDTEWVDQTGGGSGSTVTVDADGTVVVDATTVELATDAQLAAEATTRAADDATLTAAIAAEATARAAAVTAEASARASADTALDGRVDTLEAEQGGSRPPSGGAGGVLSGTYPNPGFAVDMATQAELDTETAARIAADAAKADLVSGTVPDAQIHSSIARDTEVTAAVAAEAAARATAISTAINNLINSAPGTLDTLGEIAAALQADESTAAALATTVAGKQPLDSDLTAIAALTTTAFGRGLLELANAAAGRTAFGLGTAAVAATGDFDAAGAAAAAQAASQPLDSDLTAIAALTTTSYGRAFLALADAAAARTALALGTAATVNTGTASGDVPLLSTGGVLPIARLATGTPDGTKFVRDDGTLVAPSASNGMPTGGTTGQALQKTSNADYATSWTTPGWGGGDYFRPGYYAQGIFATGAMSTQAMALNRLYLRPFWIPVRRAFDRIGVNVTVAASAGGVLRMGIYGPGAGVPGTLVVDGGTVSSTTTGGKAVTIAQTLDPGIYWVGVVAQTAAGTVSAYPSTMITPWWSDEIVPFTSLSSQTGTNVDSISGALPSSVTPAGNSASPAVVLRAT